MDRVGVVIVGSGQGGAQVAASLREEGYLEPIFLVGEEQELPYQRPPLSKGYLSGKTPTQELALRSEGFYTSRSISLLCGQRGQRIDRATNQLVLESGRTLGYEHLVLATGARPRPLVVPGIELENVMPLRSHADARAIRDRLQTARSVVVVGAGFIGLEVAVVANAMGRDVHVIEFADRALKRAVSSEVGGFLAEAQVRRGVRFSFSTGVSSLIGDKGRVTAVLTSAGTTIAADLVVVGVGVQPNVELASEAGLTVDEGIVVDAQLRTSDPLISAIGDCARFPANFCSNLVRLESVQNAVDQARFVAMRLTKKIAADLKYDKLPWFWSDQGEYRLQIAGVCSTDDEVVIRGDISKGKFSILRFRGESLTAVESVNSAADHMAARKLLAEGASISRSLAADATQKLSAIVRTS